MAVVVASGHSECLENQQLVTSCSKQEAFEKCWAHSLLRAAVTLPVTRCR